jgi:hypothetical protein
MQRWHFCASHGSNMHDLPRRDLRVNAGCDIFFFLQQLRHRNVHKRWRVGLFVVRCGEVSNNYGPTIMHTLRCGLVFGRHQRDSLLNLLELRCRSLFEFGLSVLQRLRQGLLHGSHRDCFVQHLRCGHVFKRGFVCLHELRRGQVLGLDWCRRLHDVLELRGWDLLHRKRFVLMRKLYRWKILFARGRCSVLHLCELCCGLLLGIFYWRQQLLGLCRWLIRGILGCDNMHPVLCGSFLDQ